MTTASKLLLLLLLGSICFLCSFCSSSISPLPFPSSFSFSPWCKLLKYPLPLLSVDSFTTIFSWKYLIWEHLFLPGTYFPPSAWLCTSYSCQLSSSYRFCDITSYYQANSDCASGWSCVSARRACSGLPRWWTSLLQWPGYADTVHCHFRNKTDTAGNFWGVTGRASFWRWNMLRSKFQKHPLTPGDTWLNCHEGGVVTPLGRAVALSLCDLLVSQASVQRSLSLR